MTELDACKLQLKVQGQALTEFLSVNIGLRTNEAILKEEISRLEQELKNIIKEE